MSLPAWDGGRWRPSSEEIRIDDLAELPAAEREALAGYTEECARVITYRGYRLARVVTRHEITDPVLSRSTPLDVIGRFYGNRNRLEWR